MMHISTSTFYTNDVEYESKGITGFTQMNRHQQQQQKEYNILREDNKTTTQIESLKPMMAFHFNIILQTIALFQRFTIV